LARGILGAVAEVSAGSVPHAGQEIALRHAVAAQPIRDDLARPVLETGQQALKKRFAAVAFRRSWTRMSSTIPCWSTARQK
jgi:hypothetical protein